MGQLELNEGLARAGQKKGEPARNSTGANGSYPGVRKERMAIDRALKYALGESCGVPGYEHMTKWEWGIQTLMDKFMDGDRWAVTFVCNRLFGRVPVAVDVAVQDDRDMSALTEDALRARVERIREMLVSTPAAEPVKDYTDAVVVEQGSALPGAEPNGP